MMKMKYCLLVMLWCECPVASAQPQYEAKLGKVEKDGLYKILLLPSITGRCQFGLHDLQILSEDGKTTNYSRDYSLAKDTDNTTFPVIVDGRDTKDQYYVVVENKRAYYFDRIWMTLQNSPGIKNVTVSGSNDDKQWISVRDCFSFDLESWDNEIGEKSHASFSLPTINYKFLKIQLIGNLGRATKITSVAPSWLKKHRDDRYAEVPAPTLSQTDNPNDSISRVTFHFDHVYPIHKIEFEAMGDDCFRRFASFDRNVTFASHEGGMFISRGVQSFWLLGEPFTPDILMEISNKGEMPIKITNAKGFQFSTAIVAYLKANKAYKLAFGDSIAAMPRQDIKHPTDTNDDEIPELSVGEVMPFSHVDLHSRTTASNRVWILCFLLAGIVTFGFIYLYATKNKQECV